MGIPLWEQRHQSQNPDKLLSKLAKEVQACERCPLHKTRKQTVFSRGNPEAKLMLIGEAPGFHEDQEGLPFVGKAGQLLNQMMKSIGFDDKNFYIANVLKCRPPNNRDPEPSEITACCSYLAEQIELIRPNLILALGRFAGQFLSNKPSALKELRSKVQLYQEVPFMVTYHPAYLLRNPKDKKKAYFDLISVKQWLVDNK